MPVKFIQQESKMSPDLLFKDLKSGEFFTWHHSQTLSSSYKDPPIMIKIFCPTQPRAVYIANQTPGADVNNINFNDRVVRIDMEVNYCVLE